MSKELEALEILLKAKQVCDVSCIEMCNNCQKKNAYNTLKQALLELKSIDNANPSEALECLDRIDNTLCLNNIKGKLEFGIDDEHIDCDSVIGMIEDLETIKQALMERVVWKNLHNTKVKVPLCDVFNNPVPLSKEERYKYIEHIYYHWEEMKEALEEQNKQLVEENIELKKKSNKHYLTWEDLEFKEERQTIKVRMGNNIYNLFFYKFEYSSYKRCHLCNEEETLIYDIQEQLFNDLHLERVE